VISDNFRQFYYLDRQLQRPDWRGRRILDFGGNCGNFLSQAKGRVRPDCYWCLDVSRDALEEGRKQYPAAHWIFYDRFNLQYNPTGTPSLSIPTILPTFDFIAAYSVFTHTSENEMLELVAQLRTKLEPRGTLVFTFIDPHCVPETPRRHAAEKHARLLQTRDSNLQWRLNRRKDVNPLFDAEEPVLRAAGCERCWLVNDHLYLPGESQLERSASPDPLYESFYTSEYIQTLFPDAEVLAPVNGERQHACLLRRERAGK
jgi:SAM-dependent methyltransferase